MDKSQRSKSYKNAGENMESKRAMRAYRRSLDWKSCREKQYDRQRNLSDDLSPVKEVRQPVEQVASVKKSTKQARVQERMQQLEKWREERKLKQKIEAKRQKPVFKVSTMKHKEYELKTIGGKDKKPTTNAPTSAPSHAPTKTTTATSKTAPSRAKSTASSRPATTRSTASVPASAKTTATTRPSRTTSQSRRETAQAPPSTRGRQAQQVVETTRSRVTATNPQFRRTPVVREPSPVGRMTRSRTAAATATAPATRTTRREKASAAQPASKKAKTERAPAAATTSPPAPIHQSTINMERGSQMVFGYTDNTDFTFNAPMEFKPLSPRTANSFLGGAVISPIPSVKSRCSTPKAERKFSDEETEIAEKDSQPPPEEEEQKATPARATPNRSARQVSPMSTNAKSTREQHAEDLEPLDEVEEEGEEHAPEKPSVAANDSLSKPETPTSAAAEEEEAPAVFKTPRSSTQAARRRSTMAMIARCASGGRTPKEFRKSFILRHLSPEEGVQVLKHSPMIEMGRRHQKISPCNTGTGSSLPTYDDIDDYIPPARQTEQAADTQEPVTESADPAKSVESEIADAVPSPAKEAPSEVPSATPVHDVPYFRELLSSQTERLNSLCSKWEEVLNSTPTLTEDDQGEIRTSIGKAQLLIAQRFKQFSGLVDNCEFKTGEKETTCQDLDGFWDMVYFQVEDIDGLFSALDKLQANNWQREQLKVVAKKKKVLKKKPAVTKPAAPGAGRSKFAAFLAKKKAATEAANSNTNEAIAVPEVLVVAPSEPTFATGIFVSESPGKKSRSYPNANTPQKTASAKKKSRLSNAANITPLLRCVMESNVRRSLQANSIPKQNVHTTPTTNALPGSLARRRSSSEQCVRSRRSLEAALGSSEVQRTPGRGRRSVSSPQQASPLVTGGVSGGALPPGGVAVLPSTPDLLSESELPFTRSLGEAPSLFTPVKETTPVSRRRSKRRSVAAKDTTMEVSESTENKDDFISTYLMPSSADNVPSTVEPLSLDAGDEQLIEDIDMAPKVKCDLEEEFNKHSTSTKKRRSHSGPAAVAENPLRGCILSTPSDGRRSMTDQRRRRSRRSVRFTSLTSPPGEKLALKLPSTPINRDPLGVRSRRSSSYLEDVKENVPSRTETPPAAQEANVRDTLSTKMARLRMDQTPGVRTRRSMSLLRTPSEGSPSVEGGEDAGAVDLMSFSPVPNLVSVQTPQDIQSPRTRRKSRLSLL